MAFRTLAIGDIHGNLTQFDVLLEALTLTAKDHLVLLGDYVDRGPESSGVIRRIMEMRKKSRVSAIMGNHEEMMLGARSGRSDLMREWVLNGGDATLYSYGGMRGQMRDVPKEHWEFLENGLVDYVETETHIFVHASCLPDHPMSEQPEYVLRWERCDGIRPHESGKVIVCGHTPQRDGPMNKGYAICIDTGAAFGRVLTCLEAGSGKLTMVDADARVTRGHISDYEEGGEED